jgi:hypothetical protein
VAALRFLYTVTLQKTWPVQAVIPAPKTPRFDRAALDALLERSALEARQ